MLSVQYAYRRYEVSSAISDQQWPRIILISYVFGASSVRDNERPPSTASSHVRVGQTVFAYTNAIMLWFSGAELTVGLAQA